ncbi:ADP-ribosylglycohydrolase family protein [Streptomyces sp. INA 01156]
MLVHGLARTRAWTRRCSGRSRCWPPGRGASRCRRPCSRLWAPCGRGCPPGPGHPAHRGGHGGRPPRHRRVLRPGGEDVRHGLCLAVNQDGPSAAAGALTGGLLGALHGETALRRPGSPNWRAVPRSWNSPTTSPWR